MSGHMPDFNSRQQSFYCDQIVVVASFSRHVICDSLKKAWLKRKSMVSGRKTIKLK